MLEAVSCLGLESNLHLEQLSLLLPPSEVTFHIPRANLSIRRLGRQGLHLRLPSNPLCTSPSWFPLQVVGPLGDGLVSLVRAWPGRVPRGATQPPGALRRVPTPGLGPGLRCTGRRHVPRLCCPHEGQLKLSVFKEHQTLIVSVLEAKDMLSECQGSCNSYVKIGMFPNSDPEGRQKTLMVPQCRNPIFLQTFYFTVSEEEDLHKRLLFTVWNSDSVSRMSVLLGCMSFGLRSLMDADKGVQGWYYLLGEELGRRKHLKVPAERNHHNTVVVDGCVGLCACVGVKLLCASPKAQPRLGII
ncbi:hypothetical protein AMECASPLE_007699 [Ameca splendens]|uniref:C2 domain-containing protein n=1 Tax=Ameca splendens TaxID=208324 RepID=A0ABV1A8N0_9TELE